MKIEIGTKYKSLIEIIGICPVGAPLTVWTDKAADGKTIPRVGISGKNGFTLISGGGVFFDAKDVEKA